MRETPERLRLHRQIDDIRGQLRYPIRNLGELGNQIDDKEVEFYGTRIRLSRILRNKYFMSFIPERVFPLMDDDDLVDKLFRSYWRLVKSEMRKLATGQVPIHVSNKQMKPIEAIGLHVLAEHRIISPMKGAPDA